VGKKTRKATGPPKEALVDAQRERGEEKVFLSLGDRNARKKACEKS